MVHEESVTGKMPEMQEQTMGSAEVCLAEVCASCGCDFARVRGFETGSPFCGETCEKNFWDDVA
jgi:hypothetical protein